MTTDTIESSATDKIAAWVAKHGVTMTAEFIPWSRSRNKAEKDPSLNWCITLWRNRTTGPMHLSGNPNAPMRDPILATDYMAGTGHCPSYTLTQGRLTVSVKECIAYECETGKPAQWYSAHPVNRMGGKPILPNLADVLNALSRDSDVLNYSTYEQWASDFGYDPDSRKGEAIYRACLEIALKLRNGFGEQAMSEMAEACADY